MQTVTHKIFGIGEVIAKEVKENDIYVTVRFTSGKEMRLAVKSFEDGFATAEGDLKEEIEKVISDKKVLEAKRLEDFIASTKAHTTTAAGHASGKKASSKTVVSGPIATAFEAYLINKEYSTETPSGHPSTVYSYISAIENDVLDEEHISWDTLKSNIDSILLIYDVGGKKEHIGAKSNYTVINALRRFAEFVNP
jgi:hypothetical protein